MTQAQSIGIEIRHLVALLALAEEGSFWRAAARLGYSQSAISQQISSLERIVGHRLVERSGGLRHVALTDAGALLLGHADAIVARLRAAQADLRSLEAGDGGTLRIGSFQSIGARVLPEVLRRFAEAHPQIHVQLVESIDDGALLIALEKAELDLAFVVLPIQEGPFMAVELLRDPYVLLTAQPSDEAVHTVDPGLLLEELAELPLIGYRQHRSAQQVEPNFRSHGIEPRVVFRSDDNNTVQALVAAGLGVAVVPLLSVDPDATGTRIVPLGDVLDPRRIGVALHRDRAGSTAADAFTDTARTVCAGIQQGWGGESSMSPSGGPVTAR